MRGQIAKGRSAARSNAKGPCSADQNEDDDGGDLDRREPEFKLTICARGHKVHGGQNRHQGNADAKLRQGREPSM